MAIDPLAYPWPARMETGLLTDNAFTTDRAAVDDALRGRIPVLAVGSNAAETTLRRKLANGPLVVPMIVVTVKGLISGVSAHVNWRGYIPAAPAKAPARKSRLIVTWLDPAQLEAMDATEPNYHRTQLSNDVVVSDDATGTPIQDCAVYASRHGVLIDPHTGEPWELAPQPELITRLLTESPSLRAIVGATPKDFVTTMLDEDARQRARQILVEEGRVRREHIAS